MTHGTLKDMIRSELDTHTGRNTFWEDIAALASNEKEAIMKVDFTGFLAGPRASGKPT